MVRHLGFAVLIGGALLASPAMAQDAPDALVYSQSLGADAVRMIQDKLNTAGYSTPVDGTWAPSSEAALRSFQQARGLQPTGQMNQATAATLGLNPEALLGLTPAAPAPAAPPPDAAAPAPQPTPPAAAAPAAPRSFSLGYESVRLIQARLRDLGFYHGALDGVWGGGSESALQGFQAANGLPADGRITEATVQALGIDPAAMRPQ